MLNCAALRMSLSPIWSEVSAQDIPHIRRPIGLYTSWHFAGRLGSDGRKTSLRLFTCALSDSEVITAVGPTTVSRSYTRS